LALRRARLLALRKGGFDVRRQEWGEALRMVDGNERLDRRGRGLSLQPHYLQVTVAVFPGHEAGYLFRGVGRDEDLTGRRRTLDGCHPGDVRTAKEMLKAHAGKAGGGRPEAAAVDADAH